MPLLSSVNTKSSSSSSGVVRGKAIARSSVTSTYGNTAGYSASSGVSSGGSSGGGFLSGMGSLGGILSAFMPIMESMSTRSSLMQSSKLIQQGAEIEAQGYRDAAKAAIQAANYNNETDARNTKRNVDIIAREAMQVVSTQTATAGASGFATSSRSFLSVMDATLDDYTRAFNQERYNLQSRQTSVLFEAATQAQALENQALTAEWRAKVEQQKIKAQMPSMLSTVMQALGALGGLGGGAAASGGSSGGGMTSSFNGQYYAPAKSSSAAASQYRSMTNPISSVMSSVASKGIYMPSKSASRSGYGALTKRN